jgi:hypothetical protein
MNQYLTIAEYRTRGGKVPADVSDDELNLLIQLASVKVDRLTFGRIRGGDLNRITPYQADLVQQATVFQTDYLYDVDVTAGGLDTGGLASWSVTDISMSYDTNSGSSQWLRENNISPMANELLSQSGLTWRGV